ncbi:SDR family NAD(P)-dependent oxidoreductase [Micromonospora sp. NBC_01796]|uniref:SDR family NAD(P)-dependent oxidoreductase n=1 Tax=Micromonospora sp. NBC_01796 TaxID=2975987 RepID=UPI002DD7E11C|nr:SDR family NAD(P)-dependent oxidoreductase [Micromonospora sp. NBC_01796]WSA85667.1 SDR family NAD(P)-dependent oxidoreductase [Micromonospora sp. NBC_01796]
MKTVLVSGGTRGIGRGLVLSLLGSGDRVMAVGSGAANGAALVDEATRLGMADRLSFIRADLSSVARTVTLIDELVATEPELDALVLGAFRYNPRRIITAEGFEHTFALYVLNRFLLARGLLPALERAADPVIVSLCGTGGIPVGRIHWDDLQLSRRYSGLRATMQAARANDLLGVGFTGRHPDTRVRYVLYNPLFVDTALADPFTQPTRALVKGLSRLFAAPVAQALPPILGLLATPPDEPLSAYRRGRRVRLSGSAFAPDTAARLHRVLDGLSPG